MYSQVYCCYFYHYHEFLNTVTGNNSNNDIRYIVSAKYLISRSAAPATRHIASSVPTNRGNVENAMFLFVATTSATGTATQHSTLLLYSLQLSSTSLLYSLRLFYLSTVSPACSVLSSLRTCNYVVPLVTIVDS